MRHESSWQTEGRFRDRAEAGTLLAEALAGRAYGRAVVAAIPRGGVAVARPLALELGLPLTVLHAHKLAAPTAPDLAFGAVDEDGEALTSAVAIDRLGLTDADVEEAVLRVRSETERRMRRYRAPSLARFLPGAAVIIVDDGLASGLTMLAAIAYARRHGALEVTVAVPCASAQAAALVRAEVDHLVALVEDDDFQAIGAYYAELPPVSDDQVVAMLDLARLAEVEAGARPSGRRVSFPNARGAELVGDLLMPPGAGPFPLVVFAPGADGARESPRDQEAAEALREAGFASLRFHLAGHEASEGALEAQTREQRVDDLGAAIDVGVRLPGVDPASVAVVGADSGGAIALMRAAIDPRIRALALRSADPHGAWAAAGRVTVPTLLVVGALDEEGLGANVGLRARLGAPTRLEVVAGAGRRFEQPEALRRAMGLAVAWLREQVAPDGAPRATRGAA